MLFGLFLLVFLLVFVVGGTVFWVVMIIECATKESNRDKQLIWILIILFTHWIGAMLYYFVRRPQRIAEVGA